MPASKRPLFIGNGDIKTLKEAKQKAKKYNLDGVMVGRGIFGNPWFFNSKKNIEDISLKDKFKVLIEHTNLYEKLLGKKKPFDIMKKHFKAYIYGFDGAKELRMKLMTCKTAKEVEKVIKNA